MRAALRARFDKEGRRLPDSGRGCGCGQCAKSGAAPYERRMQPRDGRPAWNAVHRRAARALQVLEERARRQAA